MSKRGGEPGARRVALLASLWKAQRRVVRSPLIVCRMTGVAVGGKGTEIATRVTASAIEAGVGARQRKRRVLVPRRRPGGDAVALLASMGEALSHMAGRRLVVGGVTGIAVRRDWPKNTAGVAAGAVQSRMPAREREKVVTHKRLLPAERQVAALTIGGPSAGNMIRRRGARQVGPVAQVAFDRRPAELAGSRSRVTILTGGHRVGSKQRKSRPRMLGDQPCRPPTDLLMAPLAVQAQRRTVRVRVTSSASTGGKGGHRAAIVVASQAGRRGVHALERITRLLLVIEGKVLAQDIPPVSDMADSTIAGKCLMRHDGSPSAAPPLPWRVQPAIDQSHSRHRREQSAKEYFGTPVVLPHYSHRHNRGIRQRRVRRPYPIVLSYRILRDMDEKNETSSALDPFSQRRGGGIPGIVWEYSADVSVYGTTTRV